MHIGIPGKLDLVSAEACSDFKWQTYLLNKVLDNFCLSLFPLLSLSPQIKSMRNIYQHTLEELTNQIVFSPLLLPSSQVHCTCFASESRCQTLWKISLKSSSLGIPISGDGEVNSVANPGFLEKFSFSNSSPLNTPIGSKFSESCNHFVIFSL